MVKPNASAAQPVSPPLSPRWRLGFVAVLLFAGLLGWLATQHGMFYFPDEFRYFLPLTVWHAEQSGQAGWAEALLGSALDRPFYYLVYAPVAFLHLALAGNHAEVLPSSNWLVILSALTVPQVAQTGLFVLNTGLMMRLTRLILHRPALTLLAGILFALWPPNLFFVRHLLPPLLAETFLLISLVLLATALQKDAKEQKLTPVFIAGLFWWLQFEVYPGFYYTLLGILVALWVSPRGTIRQAAVLISAIVLPLLLTEAAFQLFLHQSHLGAMRTLAGTVTQGNPGLGLGFLMEYYGALSPVIAGLAAGLGILALTWLIGVLRGVPLIVSQLMRYPIARVLVVGLLAMQVWLALFVEVTHSVLYGRLLLPLGIPLILLFCLMMRRLVQTRQGGLAAATLLVFLLVFPARDLLSQRFPLDMTRAFAENTGQELPTQLLHQQRFPDFALHPHWLSSGQLILETRTLTTQSGERATLDCNLLRPVLNEHIPAWLLINRDFVWPVGQVHAIDPDLLQRSQRVFQSPHPVSHPLYQLEGLNRNARIRLKELTPEMIILKQPCHQPTGDIHARP